MTKRIKKAALIAAFGYFSVAGLGFGLLRAAQQTRRTLYGGQPVMAQLSRPLPETDAYQLALGGGEWELTFSLPALSGAEQAAAQLPPCTVKLLLRLAMLADRAADYTAECISGM